MAKIHIDHLSENEIAKRGINSWPVWTKGISKFDWFYDMEEECLILEGEVIVETKDGNYTLQAGDFVTFAEGLECIWDIKEPIKKHFNFV